MLARLHRSMEKRDEGFTLIELLVVMIIIGILAAIAIPVFLNQRKKAVDTAAKADVSTLGKEVATYFVDNTALPTVAIGSGATAGRYLVNSADVGKVSANISAPTISVTDAAAPSTTWCVEVTEANGIATNQKYSASGGLAPGACP
jgi:type IV pilus assembly protein PilA